MTYKIYRYEDYLIPIECNVSKENLHKYGEICDKIYDNYENGNEVGFLLRILKEHPIQNQETYYYAFIENGEK